MLGNLSLNIANIDTVYYHGSCPDGIIAREVLKLSNKPLKFFPYYFDEFANIPSNALFIDCSPKSYQTELALQNGCLIAEHHTSFDYDYWHPFHNQILFGENSNAESGAELALWLLGVYDPSYHNERVIELVRHIAISDTWKKDDPDFAYARMIAGYVGFFGNDFSQDLETLLTERGNLIREFGKVQDRQQERYAATAIRTAIDDHKVAFINETNISNASELLRNEGNDVIVGFKIIFDPKINENIIIYSLRSNERFDCSVFCKKNGGGGHKAAAGFSVHYNGEDPIEEFIKRFQEA